MSNFFSRYFTPSNYSEQDGIEYWREKIFLSSLPFIFVLGFIALIAGIYASIRTHFYIIIFFDTLAYLLLFVLVIHRIKLRYRINLLLMVVYGLGIFLLLVLGPLGAGYIYIIGASVVASLLLGLRASLISFGFNVLLIISIGIGLNQNLFGSLLISQYDWIGWLTVSVNILIINGLTSIPISLLLNGLEKNMLKQKELQKTLESQHLLLIESSQRLERANVMKNDFIANISHEIRTPLNAIIGFSELLTNSFEDFKHDTQRFSQIIYSNGQYIVNMMASAMDISLIESGNLIINNEKCTVSEILNEVSIKYPQKRMPHKNVELNIITNTIENTQFETDKNRVVQIVINLINNAIKFTNEGSITVLAKVTADSVIFEITDTGVGIPPEKQSAIFERHVKLENDNRAQGTGLGLPISKALAQLLGGDLTLTSELDKGSSFYLTIPKV